MFRYRAIYGTLCLSIALLGCGGSSDSSDNQEASQQVGASGTGPDSTQLVLDSIYYNRRTPGDFYTEPQPDPGVYQTISHIKNSDVMLPGSYDDTTPRYELCANDFSEALDWSTTASSGLGNLVDNTEHALFYQFTYTPLASPELNNLQRVYKCSMLDRSALDIRDLNTDLGQYTETVQNSANIKLLIEYLWSFTESNNYGNAILNNTISDAGNYYLHTMQHARLTSALALGSTCDRIDIYLVNYQIQKSDGAITVSEDLQNILYSRYQDGNATICQESP
ncbi:MAG: hypothetical protein JXA04_00090 [Gammaproteobacteria bacterium]|nr:hypothetical protein [Gammaproteobacteria bacterium]